MNLTATEYLEHIATAMINTDDEDMGHTVVDGLYAIARELGRIARALDAAAYERADR